MQTRDVLSDRVVEPERARFAQCHDAAAVKLLECEATRKRWCGVSFVRWRMCAGVQF